MLSAVRAAARRLYPGAGRDDQHASNLGEGEPAAEDKAQYVAVAAGELPDRAGHVGQFRAVPRAIASGPGPELG